MCGSPLISYTITAALQSSLFTSVVVSTDSPEIADIAEHYGAEVLYRDSETLSDDYTPVSLVTLDVVKKLNDRGVLVRDVAQLLPNCPLRDSTDILNSYKHFLESGTDCQISISRYGWFNPWWAMTRNEKEILAPIFSNQLLKRSQDLPELYCPTGAIWWAHAVTLQQEKTYHCHNRTGWEIPWDHAVDIDTDDDWRMAEILMTQRVKNSQ
jgi:N-acylneuraminate cytidylyltransferase